MEQMYKGIPFSPTATLTMNISATDTIIPVSDVDAFPDAPNIATIGSIAGPNETIIYTGKTTTSLTGCTRGVEGTASDWAVDELIGRNFTAKDHADMVKNIEELESNKLDASYKVDVVNTADVSVGGKALDARQNNPNITGTLAQQINVLSEKTPINLNPGSGYTISYQTSYIQNNNIYIDAIIKKTDDTAFTTGNLYVAYSNLLPANSIYPINAVPFSTSSGSTAINDNLLALIMTTNVIVKIERTDIRCVRITGLIPRR